MTVKHQRLKWIGEEESLLRRCGVLCNPPYMAGNCPCKKPGQSWKPASYFLFVKHNRIDQPTL